MRIYEIKNDILQFPRSLYAKINHTPHVRVCVCARASNDLARTRQHKSRAVSGLPHCAKNSRMCKSLKSHRALQKYKQICIFKKKSKNQKLNYAFDQAANVVKPQHIILRVLYQTFARDLNLAPH